MKNSEKSFKLLVKGMDALQEDQMGQLKGGFQAVSSKPSSLEDVTINGFGCKCKKTE